VIEVRGLTKRYGSTVAVDRLSFDVPPGAVTGFLGLNGSGKSTTMRMILGLDSPDAGHARIGGQPYRRLRWPAYASRRLSTQNVTASRMAASTTKMPVSMPWNAQNRLAGW